MVNKISKIMNIYYIVLIIALIGDILLMIYFNSSQSLYLDTPTYAPDAYINPNDFRYKIIEFLSNAELIMSIIWLCIAIVVLFYIKERGPYFLKIVNEGMSLFIIIIATSLMSLSFESVNTMKINYIIIPLIFAVWGIVATYVLEKHIS